MSFVAAAIGGAAVIGAGVSIYGANKAASTQAAGQDKAAQTQEDMFNTITANEKPFMSAGQDATTSLSQLLGTSGTPGSTVSGTGLPQGYLAQQFDPNSLDSNPAYQFALKTGGQATRNADTPGVGALSGAALKDLTAFDVGTANQYENQYYNQFQTNQNSIYSRLAGIAGLGQNAAGNLGNNGAQLGTGVAQAQAGSAASTAAGIVGATNAFTGGLNTAAGAQYLTAGSAPSQNIPSSNLSDTSAFGGLLGGAPGGKVGGPVYTGMKEFSGTEMPHYAAGGPVGLKHLAAGGGVYGWGGPLQLLNDGNGQGSDAGGGSTATQNQPQQLPSQPAGMMQPVSGPLPPSGTPLPGGQAQYDSVWDFSNNAPTQISAGTHPYAQVPSAPPPIGSGGMMSTQAPQPGAAFEGAPSGGSIGGTTLNNIANGVTPGVQAGPTQMGFGSNFQAQGENTPPAFQGGSANGGIGGQTLNNVMNGGGWGVQNPWEQPQENDSAMGGGGGAKDGGPIYGPGGPKTDSIPAMLSNGEHVFDAASVDAMGGGDNTLGQKRLNSLRELLKARTA